jgi:hypothetical protein
VTAASRCKWFELVVLYVAIVLAAGCVATQPPNIKDAGAVGAGQGVLLLRMTQNDPHGRVLLQRHLGGIPSVAFQTAAEEVEGGIRVVNVTAGTYAFRRLERRGLYYRFTPAFRFVVEPGTITYIGDFTVDWRRESIAVVDREGTTLGDARRQYPKLFDGELNYRKSLATPE